MSKKDEMRDVAFNATIPEYTKVLNEIHKEASKGQMAMRTTCSDAVAERLRSEGFEVIRMDLLTNKCTIIW